MICNSCVQALFHVRPVTPRAAAKPGQKALRAHARRHRILRQRLQFRWQLIAAGFRDAQRVAQSARIAMEERRHRLGRLQVVLPVGEEMRPYLVQAAIVADGSQHIAQRFFRRRGIVDVVGGGVTQLQRLRHFDQGGNPLFVIGAAVMMQLDPKSNPAQRAPRNAARLHRRRASPRLPTQGRPRLRARRTRRSARQCAPPIARSAASLRPSALDAAPA